MLSVAAASLLLSRMYIRGLGFYSDDWQILYDFERMRGTGNIDLHRLFFDFGPRPLQGLYLAGQYWLFGFAPLGYHIVNALVLAAAICLLYMLLVELRMRRSIAFAASAMMAVLPQLSTVRIWISADQIPLSMLLAMASLLCQLRFHRERRRRWLAAATVTALLSVMAYEIFAPLMVLMGLVLAWIDFRSGPTRPEGFRGALVELVPVAALVVAGLAKGAVSNRLETRPVAYLAEAQTFFRADYDWRTDYGLNLFAALDVHFRAALDAWIRTASDVLSGNVEIPVLLAAATAAVLTFWRVTGDHGGSPLSIRSVLLLGFVTWVFGHGVFLFTGDIMFSPSGVANRVLVASAIGVAIIIAAVIAWASMMLPLARRLVPFGLAIAGVVFLGFCQTVRSTSYWVQAARDQDKVLGLAKSDLAQVPPGSTVILDGVCPYDGPAVVFETYWDSASALGHVLRRPISADVISPRMSMSERGLASSIYGFPSFYPFGRSLYVYNVRVRLLTSLPDHSSAQRYFQHSSRRPLRCPEGYVGQGVLI